MKKIGLIGAGSMGSGIAQVASTAGHQVVLMDTNSAMLEKAGHNLEKILNRLVEKSKINREKADEIFKNISHISKLDDLAECDLIIEAIVEDLDVKKNVFRQLESITREDTILATNTSSLSVSSIGSACQQADRVIGIHFFNPAPLMPLVEIIPAIQTSNKTLNIAKALIDGWGKTTVVAKDTPGFIVNRVARPFYGEALRIFEEGIADAATIDWALTELGGFRMGPFTLMDFIGNDINYTVTESVFKSFFYDPRYKPAFTQQRMMEAGYLGRKSGKGYYDYQEGATKPTPNKDSKLGESIVNRIVVMLINEAADALFLNIASRDDIDNAMTKGVNYPKGLLKWADEKGITECVSELDQLYNEYREDRYRCSPLLRRMSVSGNKFYNE